LLQLDELDSIHEVMDGLGEQLQYLSRKLDRLSPQNAESSNTLKSSINLSDDFKSSIRNKAKSGLMDHG
jgi:hypothetical protein